MDPRGRKQGGRGREGGERGGEEDHELSERNNISAEDLFIWRETLPLVSQLGSLPWESFLDVKSINLSRRSIRDVYQETRMPV